MRGNQLIGGFAGVGDIMIDPATNKFYVPPSNPYVSDATMGNSNARKLDLFCPPVPTKLLEGHMILTDVKGTTTQPIRFRLQIVDFTTGAVIAPVAMPIDPTTIPPQTWTPVYDVSYAKASIEPLIIPGQYLQLEFYGYGGAAGAGNNFSCQPYWRFMIAS